MTGIDNWLARKYAIQGQEADARTTSANADAALQRARALNMPAEGALVRAQAGLQAAQAAAVPITTDAQAGYYGAMGRHADAAAGLTGVQAQVQGLPLGQADTAAADVVHDRIMGYSRQQHFTPSAMRLPAMQPSSNPLYATADGGYAAPGQPTQYRPGANDLTGGHAPSFVDLRPPAPAPSYTPSYDAFGGSSLDQNNAPANAKRPGIGFSKGTSKVPGKGPSNVDSVPANLAPNEAVLNAGGADVLGRQTIDLLNAIGALKMASAGAAPQQGGMPAPTGTPGFAAGTSDVTPPAMGGRNMYGQDDRRDDATRSWTGPGISTMNGLNMPANATTLTPRQKAAGQTP